MRFIEKWRRRRAARRYGLSLGPWLGRAYGASVTYTPGQIARAIRELKLNPDYAVFAYAPFLDKEDFDLIAPALPVVIDYGEARSLVLDQIPLSGTFGSAEPLRDNKLESMHLAHTLNSMESGAGRGHR